ncbi:nuclear transport factor 2 family protein [Sphingomonas sp. 28-63-12]|uniref:nuclear transport factor 2 family protein n=1 Tax=Sphingomonas sp. 28-63-12 TaxID=1970434 RepID=UPI0035A8349F
MKTIVIALASAIAVWAAPALAKDAAVEAPIYQFLDAFNKGDIAAAAATHADDAHITDEFAPHFWGGHDVLKRWAADFDKDAAAKGLTNPKVVLGGVTRELVEGDRAYVVVPSVYTFTLKGVAMRETAQMTFALHKEDGGWKIVSWTWTGPDASPVP